MQFNHISQCALGRVAKSRDKFVRSATNTIPMLRFKSIQPDNITNTCLCVPILQEIVQALCSYAMFRGSKLAIPFHLTTIQSFSLQNVQFCYLFHSAYIIGRPSSNEVIKWVNLSVAYFYPLLEIPDRAQEYALITKSMILELMTILIINIVPLKVSSIRDAQSIQHDLIPNVGDFRESKP